MVRTFTNSYRVRRFLVKS